MLGNIEGESRLAHRGPTAHDYQVALLKARGHTVEVLKARGHSGDGLLLVVEVLNHLEAVFDDVLEVGE